MKLSVSRDGPADCGDVGSCWRVEVLLVEQVHGQQLEELGGQHEQLMEDPVAEASDQLVGHHLGGVVETSRGEFLGRDFTF